MDKILNHISSSVEGVAVICHCNECLEDRKEALENWGEFVMAKSKVNGN